MSYHDEEQIKAQLRALTTETRKLRQELDALVKSGPAKRGLVHISGKVQIDPPSVGHERRKPRTKKR